MASWQQTTEKSAKTMAIVSLRTSSTTSRKADTTKTTTSRAYRRFLSSSTLKFIMLAIATRSLVQSFRQVAQATSTTTATTATHHSALRSASATSSLKKVGISNNISKVFRRIQVHIIHRHGDRSPITPLKDEAYWQSQLIPETTLTKIAKHTRLKTADDENHNPNTHTAKGRGPFGKLTELGLLQMVQLGTALREQLVLEDDDATTNATIVEEHSGHRIRPFLFTPQRPFHPQQHLRVYSTDFPRTIQSVQGLLIGLFPDGIPVSNNNNNDPDDTTIEIDVRHTPIMIPDPQPRRTREQVLLEERLARRPHMLQRERDLRPLAVRATQALHELLAPDARETNFGVGDGTTTTTSTAATNGGGLEEEHDSIEVAPLSWNQLAEVSKCLDVRQRLPPGLSTNDVQVILEHAAWRWFQTFQNPRLADLAMGELARRIVVEGFASSSSSTTSTTTTTTEPPQPLLTLWSAHDSTLIGLMCAFRLKRPSTWPEYASCLLVERLEDCDTREQFVRFRLNGEILPSQVLASPETVTTTATASQQQPQPWLEMVPLQALVERFQLHEKVHSKVV